MRYTVYTVRITFLFVVLICLPASTFAQKDTSAYDHVSAGFYGGIGEGFAAQIEIAAHFKPKLFARFHVLRMTYVPDNVPDDYSAIICFVGKCKPRNELFIFSGLFGKKIIDNPKFSFSMEAGPSVIRFTTVEMKETGTGFFGTSYDETYATNKAIGLTIVPRFESKISGDASVQFLLVANWNSLKPVIIPSVGIIIRSKATSREPDPLPMTGQD